MQRDLQYFTNLPQSLDLTPYPFSRKTTKMFPSRNIMLLLSTFLAIISGTFADIASAADSVLRFPDGITWKGIFDDGFRPKHVRGLERRTCEVAEQSFLFELRGNPEPFSLDPGLLSFELRSDDSIRMIWHQSKVPVSMEEGRRRLEHFEKLMAGHITQKGRMPVVVDEATASVNTGSEFESIALIDGYWISYGFNSSFIKKAPLIPHFYVSLREPVMGGLPPRNKIVAPPEGYEWYSLDPKIDTPAPGIRRPMNEAERPAVVERPRPEEQKKRSETQEAADKSGFNPLWLIAVLGGILIVAAVAIIRRFRKV